APADRVAAHEPPDDPEETRADEHEAASVQSLRRAVGLVETGQRERNEGDADRDVEPEDPVPGDAADDRAPNERSERDGEPADSAPRTERDSPSLGRNCGRQDR